MWTSLRRAVALVIALLSLAATASAGGGPLSGPVYDITHFDVIPIPPPPVDFQKTAYKALFAYRNASQSDPGLESFRIINWQLAKNHSFIVDVWNSEQEFEKHLARDHSVDFRFAVQNQPPNGICCIGSPIDDRQYSQVESVGIPWTSNKFPATVGAGGALWVIIYVDFLEEDLVGNSAQQQLVKYGATSLGKNPGHLLDYTVLQQLDRANRYVILEVWDTAKNYTDWAAGAVTTAFVAKITPLLGSPLDTRLNSLCGKTHSDTDGCIPP
jgi:quinol monooxygenase YgiN